MGHQRLGPIPKTLAFKKVVELVRGTSFSESQFNAASQVSIVDDVEIIAIATLHAARDGLNSVHFDNGFNDVFYLLTQIVLASRDDDNWRKRFALLGIELQDDSGMFEFTSRLGQAIQDRFDRSGAYSDVSEMARKSAIEAIASLASDRAITLFGSGPEELRDAVKGLSTKKGFAKLGRAFFSGFLYKYLNFYLCKETPNAVREFRLDGIEGIRDFETALKRHCFESAKIVEDFCGTWYTKKEWIEGINPVNAAHAASFAIAKLQRELEKQGGGE